MSYPKSQQRAKEIIREFSNFVDKIFEDKIEQVSSIIENFNSKMVDKLELIGLKAKINEDGNPKVLNYTNISEINEKSCEKSTDINRKDSLTAIFSPIPTRAGSLIKKKLPIIKDLTSESFGLLPAKDYSKYINHDDKVKVNPLKDMIYKEEFSEQVISPVKINQLIKGKKYGELLDLSNKNQKIKNQLLSGSRRLKMPQNNTELKNFLSPSLVKKEGSKEIKKLIGEESIKKPENLLIDTLIRELDSKNKLDDTFQKGKNIRIRREDQRNSKTEDENYYIYHSQDNKKKMEITNLNLKIEEKIENKEIEITAPELLNRLNDETTKFIPLEKPEWAATPILSRTLKNQEEIDADEIFGEVSSNISLDIL